MSTLEEQLGGPRNVVGGPFGSNLTKKDYTDKGIPVIRGSNMVAAGRWVGGDFAFVSEEKAESDLGSNLAYPGDIIVTQRGTLGQVAIVPHHYPFKRYVISQSQMAVRVPENKADRDFVYYFLLSPQFAAYVERSTIQTGVPHINLGILRNAPATWPGKDRQSRIASILVALDNKIQLNWRMNETLEAMARAIFKDWFIDFRPTRAKIKGQSPYLSAELWELFPTGLDNEDKPKGWGKGHLGALFDVSIGRTPPRREPQHFVSSGDGSTWLSIKTMGQIQTFAVDSEEDLTSDAIESFRVPLIPAGTVLVSFKLTVGRVAIAAKDMYSNEAIAHLVSNHKTPIGNLFAYCFMKDFDYSSLGSTSSIATAVNSKTIKGVEIIVPDKATHTAFVGTAQPLFDRIRCNLRENEVLCAIRDSLLPKLLSGEVCVAEAEEAVESLA